MNKKDTADLAELVSNLNRDIADIEDGRFEVKTVTTPRSRFAEFVMIDNERKEIGHFTIRWYTLKLNDGRISYNPEILERVNRFIVERRGR